MRVKMLRLLLQAESRKLIHLGTSSLSSLENLMHVYRNAKTSNYRSP